MTGAGALYVPPDPNAASGDAELGSAKIGFKIFGEKFLGLSASTSLDGNDPIDCPPFGGPDQAVVGNPH